MLEPRAKRTQLFANGGTFQPGDTPYFPTVPGMPQTFFTKDRRVNQSSYTDVIYNAGLQATTSGTGVTPFQIGQYGRSSPFSAEVGGERRRAYEDTTLLPETERSNPMASFSYDFTETLSGTLDLSYANVNGLNLQNDAYFCAVDNYCVGPNDAYTVNNPALQAGSVPESRPQLSNGLAHGRLKKGCRSRCAVRAARLHVLSARSEIIRVRRS